MQTVEQLDNRSEVGGDAINLKPWLWKKGQSGNSKGRPPGKTMKEYSREFLAAMTDEEREDFLDGLPKELIWKMAEGNPQNNADITTGGEKIAVGAKEVAKELKNILDADSETEESNPPHSDNVL